MSSAIKIHKVHISNLTEKQCREKSRGMIINYGITDSPFGKLFVAKSGQYIHCLAFSENIDEELARLEKQWPEAVFRQDKQMAEETAGDIFYHKKSRTFDLQMPASDFRQTVWQALLNIPAGEMSSYQQIAQNIGKPTAARAVGNAVAANPVAFLIPCHRVIQKSGSIGDYRWGADCKKAILDWEKGKKQ